MAKVTTLLLIGNVLWWTLIVTMFTMSGGDRLGIPAFAWGVCQSLVGLAIMTRLWHVRHVP